MDKPLFTLTFGQQPSSYVERHASAKQICDDFFLDYPVSHIYIISGVRGSGKTVLLTRVSKMIAENKDWLVIDVNPNREILSQVAAGLYENASVKHLFLSASFSISFKGFGISLEGKEPVSNIKTVVERMLKVVQGHGKKVLITIDEVSNNQQMRAFAHDFQSFLRDEYPVFALMTGLYENVSSLQRNKNLTFLYRAPKIELKALNLELVREEYAKAFPNVSPDDIQKMASLSKGYAFAYQVIGLLYAKYGQVEKIYDELDRYLALYVYDKIWESLPNGEKKVLLAFQGEEATTAEVIQRSGLPPKTYSVYRQRLVDRGLVNGDDYGKVSLVLPRFDVFLSRQTLL